MANEDNVRGDGGRRAVCFDPLVEGTLAICARPCAPDNDDGRPAGHVFHEASLTGTSVTCPMLLPDRLALERFACTLDRASRPFGVSTFGHLGGYGQCEIAATTPKARPPGAEYTARRRGRGASIALPARRPGSSRPRISKRSRARARRQTIASTP